MNKKTEAVIVVPDNLTEISVSAIGLCELFVAKVLDAAESIIDVKIDGKSLLVVSGNQSIKELVSMYLKSGKLASFYRQLLALARKDDESGESVLKIILRNKVYSIRLQELNALPDLHLRVSRRIEIEDFKQERLGE